MPRLAAIVLVFALTHVTGWARAASEPVIAVLYIDNHSGDSAYDVLEKGLADMLVTDLSQQGLTVVERARLQALIDEQKLQKSAFFDPKTAVKVGQGLGATHVVSGALMAMKPEIRLDLRMIEVATGEVVVTAKVDGPSEALFELEQELVGRFVAAFERRFAAPGMPETKVRDVQALLEYSRGLDLADRGELEEAKKTIEKTIRLSPSFGLARRLKDDLQKRIEASRDRRDALITQHMKTLAMRAKAAIGERDAGRRFERLAWRHLELQLLASALAPLMSDTPLGVAALGQEEAHLEAMLRWAERAREYVVELDAILASKPGAFWKAKLPDDAEALARQLRIDTSAQVDPIEARLTLAEFLLMGKLRGPADLSLMIAPPLANVHATWDKRAWQALAEADALASRQSLEYRGVRVLEQWGEALWFRGRIDDAVAKWQTILDRYPTSRQYDQIERKIKHVLGLEMDHTARELARWAQALTTCEDMGFRVGIDTVVYRRVRMTGLQALSDTVSEVEKACHEHPAAKLTWEYIYSWVARYFGKHGRCAEFETWMERAIAAGASKSDVRGWRDNWTKCPKPATP